MSRQHAMRSALSFLNKHREVCFLTGIFIVAFLLRAVWGLHVLAQTGQDFIIASDDGPTHHILAASLVQKGYFAEGLGARHFGGYGYWLFLGLIYKVFGIGNFKAVIIIQALINGFLPVLIYLISKHLLNVSVGMVAALLTAISSNLLFNSSLLAMEAISIPLIYFAIWFMISRAFTGGRRHYFILGLLLGGAFIVRNEALLLLGAAILCLLIYFVKILGLKEIVSRIVIMVIAFGVCIGIQMTHNYMQYGDTHILSNQLGESYSEIDRLSDENNKLNRMGFNPFRDRKKALQTFLNNKSEVLSLVMTGLAKKVPVYLSYPIVSDRFL